MNIDLLRQQQRWKDGLQELRTGLASVAAQVRGLCFAVLSLGVWMHDSVPIAYRVIDLSWYL